MKKILIGSFAVAAIICGFNVLADVVVTLKQKPVTLIKQGDVYTIDTPITTTTTIVPVTTVPVTTYDYYTYTDNGTSYVCTTTPAPELSGVTYTNLNVRLATGTSTVNCYPSSYFVIP